MKLRECRGGMDSVNCWTASHGNGTVARSERLQFSDGARHGADTTEVSVGMILGYRISDNATSLSGKW